MRLLPIVLALAPIYLSVAAQAASVTAEVGDVHVNSGHGFVALQGAVDVPAGGQVMVAPGGTALISYGTCKVRVGAGRVWAVQDKAPCSDGASLVDFTGRMGNTTEEGPAFDSTTLLLGLGVVGGVAAAIVIASDDDDDDDHNDNGGNGPSGSLPVSAE